MGVPALNLEVFMAISSHGYAFVGARLLCLAFTVSGSIVACGSGDPVAVEEESSGAAGALLGTAGASSDGTSIGGANGASGGNGTGGTSGMSKTRPPSGGWWKGPRTL